MATKVSIWGDVMKWFKHYTNAHQGDVFQKLEAEFGRAKAHGLYFLLVEYFALKWGGDGEPSFVVSKNILSSFLGLKQNKMILFLKQIENETSFSFEENEDVLKIKFPKLLEILHRDSIPSSQRPAKIRPKSGLEENKIKNKKKKNIYSDSQILEFQFFRDLYLKTFPGTTGGPKSQERFFSQIKTEGDRKALGAAIANYKKRLDYDNRERVWRSPKTTFETFLGTKTSGYFWREFVDYTPPQDAIDDRYERLFRENA